MLIYTRKQFIADTCKKLLAFDAMTDRWRNRTQIPRDLEMAYDRMLGIIEENARRDPKTIPHTAVTLWFLEEVATDDEATAFIYRMGGGLSISAIAGKMGKRFSEVVPLICKPLNRLKLIWKAAS